MPTGMPQTDKRVYDIRAKSRADDRWVVLAISADTTLVDLHVALLGAFEWPGSYTDAEPQYCFVVGTQRFQRGKGSRTALRKLLRMEVAFEYGCDLAHIEADCNVVKEYEVSSRRHYPKVVDAHPSIRVQDATWSAQGAARRYYREYELEERRATPKRRLPDPCRDPNSAYAHGFFSALVAGPTVMPTRWLQHFISKDHESIEDLNASAQRAMSAYNDIAVALLRRRERFGEATLAVAARDAHGEALVDWQQGFLDAMGLSPDEWMSFLSKQRRDILQPLATIAQCCEDPSKRDWLADRGLRGNLGRSLGIMTARLWEAFRNEHSVQLELGHAAGPEPKTSRNAPCPCGSGKKYKRCCGSTLRAV